MVSTKAPSRSSGIPEGYRAIPLHKSQSTPVRLCILVRQTPDAVAGSFVLLRDLHDALVYLGCLTDAGGRVLQWIEVWVQNVDGLEASLPAYRETFSNFALDERWRSQRQAFEALNPANFIQTGWETDHPLPSFLSLADAGPVTPGEGEERGTWELCLDDGLLKSAGLPPYSTSLFRYLYQPGAGKEAVFIPVVSGAPTNTVTKSLAEALGKSNHHLSFNPQGGLMMAISFCPIGYEDYADLLAGKPWKGLEQGKKFFNFDGVYRSLEDWNQIQQNGAHLFLGSHGRSGRFPETFHLKLQLLVDAFRLVQSSVRHNQLPFLNISGDSFRVKLERSGSGLPFLWTAGCALARPSHAFALPVESSEFRYFIRARPTGTSIYLPEGLSESLQGSGSVRIRKVLPPDQDRTVLEGTLVLQDKLNASKHDLLWIRLPLPSGRVDLYGHLYATESLAQGEARFRTVPQKMPEAVVAALREAEGVSFARSPFEVVPLLSSPCDLYALGVLAVRTFLVNDKNTLAIALDEILSLARQVATEHKADVPLGARVRAIFEKDKRYVTSLGPHRLVREPIEPEEALELLPSDLWYDTLATIIRLFPGMGPDSICKDYGDVSSLALETVFNRPLEDLEKLLIRSRSLIVIDWKFNREISTAINEYVAQNNV
ncbi:MAG: hypothetical protein JWR26_3729 [Pedosphaera sp.]|nr:hypothetical protein [Pedosphaera sp.]